MESQLVGNMESKRNKANQTPETKTCLSSLYSSITSIELSPITSIELSPVGAPGHHGARESALAPASPLAPCAQTLTRLCWCLQLLSSQTTSLFLSSQPTIKLLRRKVSTQHLVQVVSTQELDQGLCPAP